jgi:hypothetical protein
MTRRLGKGNMRASLDERAAVNRVLLYASDDKLKASQGPPGWLDRLDLSLTVGLPGASVAAGLRAHELRVLQVMVDKADRTIRKEGKARSLADSITGRPPPLFTFEGPAGRLESFGSRASVAASASSWRARPPMRSRQSRSSRGCFPRPQIPWARCSDSSSFEQTRAATPTWRPTYRRRCCHRRHTQAVSRLRHG